MDISRYEELVQKWIAQVLANHSSNPELTLKCCNDLIEYANRNGDESLLGFAYYYCGEIFYCLNDGKNFYGSLNRAVKYLDKVGEFDLMANCYNFLGIKATNGGNIPLALEYYSQGVEYAKKHHLKSHAAFMEINLGGLFHKCGRYREAQRYFKNAEAYFSKVNAEEGMHTMMTAIECNRVKTYIELEYFHAAEETLDRIRKNHWIYLSLLEQNVVECAEAILFHRMKHIEKRDSAVAMANEHLPQNMAILDYFDDYYDYAKMLLQAELEEAFWKVMEIVEVLIRDAGSTDLMLKIISLKIQFYRMTERSAEYLQAAGLYYELSERMAEETRVVVNNIISLRQSLETANEMRVQVEEENRILTEKSEMDALTKIANRFRLNDYSEELYAKALNCKKALAVCIMDVDYFKEFNDNYGHQAGDECLIAVADAMREVALPHGGFCARYGGDEFVLIYEDVTVEQAAEYAEELKQRIMERNIVHEYSKCIPQVTLSQGLCCGIPKKGFRMWDFMHKADENLYRIKQVSRNNYCVSDLSDNQVITGGDKN